MELVVATSAQADEVTALLEQAGVADLIRRAVIGRRRRAIEAGSGHRAGRAARGGSSRLARRDDRRYPYDVEAATRARVPIIALRCGGWNDDGLHGATEVYDDPADLLKHYERSVLGNREP